MSHAKADDTGWKFLGRTTTEWFVSLPTIAMLLLVLVISTGELVHGRLLAAGEAMFGDPAKQVQYYSLRADPTTPTCNANADIETELARLQKESETQGADLVDNLFEEDAFDPVKARASLRDSLAECQFKHDWVKRIQEHITPGVKAYRTVETAFFGLFRFGAENRSMILLILMGVV
ncbi:MAG TPA: transporter, partial [Aquabacterium sp.]|nr:transporter [Aquabacterium sp.]